MALSRQTEKLLNWMLNHQFMNKSSFFFQTVGDAISDLLLVEIILLTKGWSLQDWISCYNDLPNRQMKVKVNSVKLPQLLCVMII